MTPREIRIIPPVTRLFCQHQVVSDIKLNNGLMDNRNAIIKTIKKPANGYANLDRFRNRCLYVLRRNSYPLLNPVIPPKKAAR